MAQELIHVMRNLKKEKGLLVKAYLEKDHDGFSWAVINETLILVVIPDHLREDIMLCVSIASLQGLWNR